MRAVIDTNVLIAGLLWHGAPHALLTKVRDRELSLITSPALLAELAGVLKRSKFVAELIRSNSSHEKSMAEIRQLVDFVVDAPPLEEPVCRDPDDDVLLALAVAARADFIISGDKDLLVLGQFQGIPIINPAQAVLRFSGPVL